MSFHKIDNLEKDLFMKEQMISAQTQKLNQTAVHFTYNLNNESMNNFTQPLNLTAVVDKEK
jgi:hypothetical protein